METQNVKKKICNLRNGESLSFLDTESDLPVLILLHGNMSSSLVFFSLIKKLEKMFRLIAPDLRGFGDSSYHTPINSLYDLSDDIKLLIDKLKIKNCSLLGWSTGGIICLSFGLKYPLNTNKIIVVGSVGTDGFPIYKIDNNGKKTSEKIKEKEDLFKDKFSSSFYQAIINRDYLFIQSTFDSILFNIKKPHDSVMKSMLSQAVSQRNFLDIMLCLSNFNIVNKEIIQNDERNKLSNIAFDILIIHGENDKVIPLKMALSIKEIFGNFVLIKIYEKCGHCPFFDFEDRFVKDVCKFLNLKFKF